MEHGRNYHKIEQPDPLHPIYVWTEPVEGQVWACCAFDHSPMCRLCQRVDETLAALIENVELGTLTARAKSDGEFEFKVSQQGVVKVEEMIGTDPAMATLWAQLSGRGSTEADS